MGQQLNLICTEVLLTCVRVNKRLRVLAEKPYLPLYCAFPRSLRVEGAVYRVAGLRLVRDSYYRAIPPIALVSSPGADHVDRPGPAS